MKGGVCGRRYSPSCPGSTSPQPTGSGIVTPDRQRSIAHGSGLGRARWVVERTLAWLRHFKRLLVRYERRADIHERSSRSVAASPFSEVSSAHSDST
jgi:transposase